MPLDPNVTVIRDAEGRETFVATGGPLAPPTPAANQTVAAEAEKTEEGGDGATEDAADGDGTNSRRRKR